MNTFFAIPLHKSGYNELSQLSVDTKKTDAGNNFNLLSPNFLINKCPSRDIFAAIQKPVFGFHPTSYTISFDSSHVANWIYSLT
jgi:hypothetical protein